MSTDGTTVGATTPMHFIREIIAADIHAGKHGGRVITRFPPEPNGYLHIGHAKAICLDFGMAMEHGGRCHLRMDDTNPVKEDIEYMDSIQEDVRWLGFDWGPHFYHASDYFERMYAYAVQLIRKGQAYVCDLSAEQWKEYRGIPSRPGRESPHRDRPIAENLAIFERMRAGDFPDGSMVLRAKIDMTSPNIHLRDPVLYRILHAHHPHTQDAWCLYPTYDFAHPIEDSIEGITHSLCTLEFEVHRPLYDWVCQALDIHHPQQIEFARLALTYTVMSKRKLLELVQKQLVKGWDDPRMPTLCGLRRRGYTPAAIRTFCETVGVTKFNSLTDVALLEHCVREDLNRNSPRVMAVLDPIKVIIENAAEIPTHVRAVNNPEDPAAGERELPFGAELFIEREDFMETPTPKYFRLAPGKSVRLRYAGFITCVDVRRDAEGRIASIICRWSPPQAEVKVKATIHWLAAQAIPAEVRLYDRLFRVEEPDGDKEVDFKTHLNPDSLKTVRALLEPSLANARAGDRFQFERLGYFCVDQDSQPDALVFNRTVTLKDTWSKNR